jgi:hypothetical protein
MHDTRTAKSDQNEPPQKPSGWTPWQRRLLIAVSVGSVIVSAIVYPPAAVPIGLGLTALELFLRK